MAGGSAIRGSRVGAGPMGEAERGEAAPRLRVSFWCANGHETRPTLRRRRRGPRDLGLPAVRLAGQPRPGEPAGAAEDRAVQDAPGLREGAAQRRRRRGHPRRGARASCAAAADRLTPWPRRRAAVSATAIRGEVAAGSFEAAASSSSASVRSGAARARPPAPAPAPAPLTAPAASPSAFSAPLAMSQTSRARLIVGRVNVIRTGGGFGEPRTPHTRAVVVQRRALGEQRRDVRVGPTPSSSDVEARHRPWSSGRAAAASSSA